MTKLLSFKKTPEFLKRRGPALVRLLLKLVWKSSKVVRIEGEHFLEPLIQGDEAFIPVYWHQHHVYGAYLAQQLKKKGVNIGYLISPSADGDLIAQVAKSWDFAIIRGSSNSTGAKALRDLYQSIVKDNVSPINTTDGPSGPIHVFKPGAIMLAQLTRAKLVPVSWAASAYWQTKTWDRFIVPKPFSKVVISIGKPIEIAQTMPKEELELTCQKMSKVLLDLQRSAQQSLDKLA